MDQKPTIKNPETITPSLSYFGKSKYSLLFMMLMFIGEIFLIIPLDLVLGYFVLKHKPHWRLLAFTAAVCSTISAAVGYVIGSYMLNSFSHYIFKVVSQTTFFNITTAYNSYGTLVVFVTTFLPFPFKVVTVAAGACDLVFWQFLVVVFLSRSVRFTLISLIAFRFRDRMFGVVEQYSYHLAIGLGIILFVAYLWVTN